MFTIGLMVAVCVVALAATRREPEKGALRIDAVGVRYMRGKQSGEIAWADLIEIGILNTSDGPYLEDQFWILRGASGAGCVVPSSDGLPLLDVIGKLPRFDFEQVVRSAGCCDDASFRCWLGAPGEAAVLASALTPRTGA